MTEGFQNTILGPGNSYTSCLLRVASRTSAAARIRAEQPLSDATFQRVGVGARDRRLREQPPNLLTPAIFDGTALSILLGRRLVQAKL